jgi:hypothetical protein
LNAVPHQPRPVEVRLCLSRVLLLPGLAVRGMFVRLRLAIAPQNMQPLSARVLPNGSVRNPSAPDRPTVIRDAAVAVLVGSKTQPTMKFNGGRQFGQRALTILRRTGLLIWCDQLKCRNPDRRNCRVRLRVRRSFLTLRAICSGLHSRARPLRTAAFNSGLSSFRSIGRSRRRRSESH